jgi:hypothetical protein
MESGLRVRFRPSERVIAGRSSDRKLIEGCLRVGGEVLVGIISMLDEVAACACRL